MAVGGGEIAVHRAGMDHLHQPPLGIIGVGHRLGRLRSNRCRCQGAPQQYANPYHGIDPLFVALTTRLVVMRYDHTIRFGASTTPN